MITLLIWVGIIRWREDGTIRWPFSVPPAHVRKFLWRHGPRVYVFHNLPGVVKWVPGRMLPRRWGFGICGFEFGDRG